MIEFKDQKKLSELHKAGRNAYQKFHKHKLVDDSHEHLAKRINISADTVFRWIYADSQDAKSASSDAYRAFIWLLLIEGIKSLEWLQELIDATSNLIIGATTLNLVACQKIFKGIIVDGNILTDAIIQEALKSFFVAEESHSEKTERQPERNFENSSQTHSPSVFEENAENQVVPSWSKLKIFILLISSIVIMVILFRGVIPPHPRPICGGEVFPRDFVSPVTVEQLTLYNTANSSRAVLHNRVRSVEINRQGVWFGYHTSDDEPLIPRISFANQEYWAICESASIDIGQKLNDIITTPDERLWLITDSYGVQMFDGSDWTAFRMRDGLNDDRAYTSQIDLEGRLLVGTWQGVSEFTGSIWVVRYAENKNGQQNIFRNPVHAVAFHPSGEIWVGHIWEGISHLRSDGQWEHITVEQQPYALASNNIRKILVDSNGLVWIATSGGGVSRYNPQSNEWTIFTSENSSLVGNDVNGMTEDKYHRIWAYTSNGVSMFVDDVWLWVTNIPVLDLAFGIPSDNCVNCPYDDNHVWMATDGYGLAHRQIPSISPVVAIESVIYPSEVRPNEAFVSEITIRVMPNHELSGNDGDGLFYIGESNETLFGAHPVMGIESPQSNQIIRGGETYTFSNRNNPFQAPAESGTYESTWCVWYQTGCASELISIRFTVVPN